jgi:hypothetical protein
MKLRTLLIAAAGLTMAAGAAGAASAETPWQYHHPRRVEVNHRLDNLNHSIREERREGDINGWQARRLHAHVHMIRSQERWFARRDGGHLTRGEQARLNHEETGVRHHIPA